MGERVTAVLHNLWKTFFRTFACACGCRADAYQILLFTERLRRVYNGVTRWLQRRDPLTGDRNRFTCKSRLPAFLVG